MPCLARHLTSSDMAQGIRAPEREWCVMAVFTVQVTGASVLKTNHYRAPIVFAAPPKPKPDGLFKIGQTLGVAFRNLLFTKDYAHDLRQKYARRFARLWLPILKMKVLSFYFCPTSS